MLALASGHGSVLVAEIVPGEPWLGTPYQALAEGLTPLPMRYFHGEVPR